MIQPILPSIAEHPEAALHPSLHNPAVAHCTESWKKIHAATFEKTRNVYTAERCAAKAYRLAMPPLSGYHNICDFIACAGYGILLGAFKNEMGTKLLYAAQVALASLPREAKNLPRTPSLPEPAVIDLPTPPPLLP
jgi:hypothetical protein